MECWKFLYTSLPNIKKAVTKTESPLTKINHYCIIDGENYAECFKMAKGIFNFNDKQLLGSQKIN